MQQKTPIVLLILVAMLAAFIWVFESKTPLPPGSEKKVFAVSSGDVTKVELEHSQSLVIIEKSGDRWALTQPVKAKASTGEVQRMLSEIEFAVIRETIDGKQVDNSAQKLAEFGLDNPRLTATVASQDRSVTVRFGKDAPVGSYVYAKREGGADVYVVGKALFEALSRPADEFRDRAVLDLMPQQVERIEIKNGALEIRRKGVSWQVTRPMTARADAQKVGDLLAELSKPAILDFVANAAGDLKPFGLQEPSAELSVWTGQDAGAQILILGSPVKDHSEKLYAKRKNEEGVFTIGAEFAAKLAVRVNDVRERRLLDFQPRDAAMVEVVTPNESTKLTREKGKWLLKEPKETAADATVMRMFLDNIAAIQIKEFVEDVVTDAGKFDLDKPIATITLYREQLKKVEPAATAPSVVSSATISNGGTTAARIPAPSPAVAFESFAKILLGRVDAAKGLLFLKRDDEPFVYGVDASLADRINTTALGFQDRTILSLNADDIQKLTVQRGEQTVRLEKSADNKWQFAQGQTGILEDDRLKELLFMLASLRADQLASDRIDNLPEFGLDKPELIATLEIRPPAKPGENIVQAIPTKLELRVGKESPLRRRYALVIGQSLVFELDNSTYNYLLKLSTQPIAPPPAPAP